MTFDEYQKQALTTDSFSVEGKPALNDPSYISKILGLAGESGEVAEKYKKIIRNQDGVINPEDRHELVKELGDVLWYCAVLAKYLDADFEEVAAQNLKKLADRKKRDVIKGKGDNR